MMTASAWVASAGLCLRTRSMTFSSASISACGVDEVAATAAGGGGGLCGTGNAACCRVAGAIAAGAPACAEVLPPVSAAGGVLSDVLGDVLGTTLRAIGRGFGSGIFAQASTATAEHPTASAR